MIADCLGISRIRRCRSTMPVSRKTGPVAAEATGVCDGTDGARGSGGSAPALGEG